MWDVVAVCISHHLIAQEIYLCDCPTLNASSSFVVCVVVVSLEEEISAMKLALEKYGIRLPSFGKIGGILANEVRFSIACFC